MRTSKTPAGHGLLTSWALTGLALAGFAWTLGLQASWWQRVLLALPILAFAVLDSRGSGPMAEARLALTGALADLGWMQAPLAVAGGAWLVGLTASLTTRIVLAALIGLVFELFRRATSAAASTGGAR